MVAEDYRDELDLRSFCERFGGRFRETEKWLECRIKTDGTRPGKIFDEIADLIEETWGSRSIRTLSGFDLRLEGCSGYSSADGDVRIYQLEELKAIEIAFDKEHGEYHLTPVTKSGRGCTLVFGKYTVGGYCDKNKTEIQFSSFVAPYPI